MVASVGLLILGICILAFVSLISAVTKFKSITGIACCGIMALGGWYCAASVTPPPEHDGVTVQISHQPFPGGSETVAIARNPVNNKNVIWRYEGKPDDRVRAFFPDRNKPRLHLMGVPVDENKPRLVKE